MNNCINLKSLIRKDFSNGKPNTEKKESKDKRKGSRKDYRKKNSTKKSNRFKGSAKTKSGGCKDKRKKSKGKDPRPSTCWNSRKETLKGLTSISSSWMKVSRINSRKTSSLCWIKTDWEGKFSPSSKNKKYNSKPWNWCKSIKSKRSMKWKMHAYQ